MSSVAPIPATGDELAGRYTWILVTGAFGAFWFGWGTGSNDVANAFGTSVGAKTLTLRQAVFLAVIFEFTGAIVLGRTSAETISGGIAKADTFKGNAPLYAYGMSIVLWLGFIWQAFASYMGWNVSATHSIIGGIIGFAMCYGGSNSVFWAEPDATKVPPVKGVVPIVISWFFSPLFTGIASAIFYGLTRYFVLTSPHSTQRAVYILPIMVLCTVLIDIYFTFTKGAKKSFQQNQDDWSDEKALWISAVVAVACSIISGIFGIPYLRRRLVQKQEQDRLKSEAAARPPAELEAKSVEMVQVEDPLVQVINTAGQEGETFITGRAFGSELVIVDASSAADITPVVMPSETSAAGKSFGQEEDDLKKHVGTKPEAPKVNRGKSFKEMALRGIDYDIHAAAEEDPLVKAIHENAEKWDPDTEFIFGFLQVVSAICVIFAHGAGEVGYMAGPLAVIVNIVQNPGKNVVTQGTKTNPEIWVVLIGAFGLVVGLATYGYKVCQAVGTQMALITPSRGYAAELATSFVIMIAAQYNLPTSSSQCITGGIIGIAVYEGAKGINYRLLGLTALSWIWTMLVMGLGCALIFAQGAYAPNRFVEISYSSTLGTSYLTTCSEFNYCGSKQYLKGCGLQSVQPRVFSMGTCTNCTKYGVDTCKPYQYLKGCGAQASGACTNCTATDKAWTTEKPYPSCPSGFYLSGCPGTCINNS